MASVTVNALVEGGKATPAPPLGPSLAPTGVNVGAVIAKINEMTKDFAGMSVPVVIVIDKSDRSYVVTVGTPPTASLIKKEIGVSAPVKEEAGVKGKKTIGNLTLESALKVARMKATATLAKTPKAQLAEIFGTCLSLGVTVEGLNPKEAIAKLKAGEWDSRIK